MKTLIKKIGIDCVIILFCALFFKENCFVFVGMGIIYLGIVLYRYFNKE